MRQLYWISISLGLGILLQCSKAPTQPPKDQTITYTVHIDAMPADSLHVSMSIAKWPDGDSVHLLAPPIYADNPFFHQTGINFCNLTVCVQNGEPISYVTDSIGMGNYRSLSISFHSRVLPVDIDYDVKFQYERSPHTAIMPIPHIGQEKGYLLGNYVFMMPFIQRELRSIWRDPFDLTVTFEKNTSVLFHGDPVPKAVFATPYELLFSTTGLGGHVLFQGIANGQSYVCLNHALDSSYSTDLLHTTQTNMETLLGDIASIFGPLEQDHAVTAIVGAMEGYGGLEGTHAFSTLAPFDMDTTGLFNVVLAHEMIHSWIGIRVGELNDPWWKEGTTTYLGFMVAKVRGLVSTSFFRNYILNDLSKSYDVLHYRLSDEFVRINIFSPDSLQNCSNLAYIKGAQVCMLMDRVIRESSGNTVSLATILGEFAEVYDGRAFTRSEYLGYIESKSLAKLDTLFALYVDSVGVVPDSVLLDNYNALAAMGAFGSSAAQAKQLHRKKAFTGWLRW